MRVAYVVVAALAVLTACGPGEPAEEEVQGPTSADSTAMAAEMFDEAGFDTVSWDTHQAALDRGGVVFRFSCEKCHGATGAGDAGFVAGGDTLRPPSFLAETWRFAEDREGLRREIFTGTGMEGMPHWGLEGLKYRDIDAVSIYITETLREGG